MESFFVEISFHKKKWLINCSYNPHKSNIINPPNIISRSLDIHSTKYENIVLLGDFNACVDDEALQTFCKSYSFNSLIKQPTCFKNPENPSCIDLILTNKPCSFQTKCVIETGLSDFHRMTISVLKMHFRKLPPKIISYRDLKKFDNERFMDSLQHTLGQESFDLSKTLINFITFVIQYLTPMRRIRKIIYVGIINLLSLNPIQKLSYKEHALETSF